MLKKMIVSKMWICGDLYEYFGKWAERLRRVRGIC